MVNSTERFKRDFSIPPSEAKDPSKSSFASFPSDLVFKILSQLPPDVLLRCCRKVCRQWKRVVKIMPPQMLLLGKAIALEIINFSPEKVEFANDRLNFAKLTRCRVALLAEPEKVYTNPTDISLRLAIARAKPSASSLQHHTHEDGNDVYHDCIKNTVICARHVIGSRSYGSLYIELFRVTENCVKRITSIKVILPHTGKVKKIQHLLDKGLLLTRIDWTANFAGTQLLLHQYTTGSCILDSYNGNTSLPQTLSKAITTFSLLNTLAIRVVKENDTYKYVLLLAITTNSTQPQQSLLQYNLR